MVSRRGPAGPAIYNKAVETATSQHGDAAQKLASLLSAVKQFLGKGKLAKGSQSKYHHVASKDWDALTSVVRSLGA